MDATTPAAIMWNGDSKPWKGINSKATIKVPKSKLKSYKSMLKARGVSSKAKIKK